MTAPLPGHDAHLEALARQVRSTRVLALVAGVIAVVALVLAGLAFSRPAGAPAPDASAAPAASATPQQRTPADAGAVHAGTIVLGASGRGLPVVDVYEDYQCPACAQLEPLIAADLDALAASGEAELRFHPMSFLDQMLGNDSSRGAAEGAFCAAEQGRFLPYHHAVWANHPAREGDGWTEEQRVGIANQAGLDTTAWQACTSSGKYADDVRNANDLPLASGITGTPTLALNGARLDLQQVMNGGGLAAYVRANG